MYSRLAKQKIIGNQFMINKLKSSKLIPVTFYQLALLELF